jgi:hypothetical protein
MNDVLEAEGVFDEVEEMALAAEFLEVAKNSRDRFAEGVIPFARRALRSQP